MANKTTEQFTQFGEGVLSEVANSQGGHQGHPLSSRSNGGVVGGGHEDTAPNLQLVSLYREHGPATDLVSAVNIFGGRDGSMEVL